MQVIAAFLAAALVCPAHAQLRPRAVPPAPVAPMPALNPTIPGLLSEPSLPTPSLPNAFVPSDTGRVPTVSATPSVGPAPVAVAAVPAVAAAVPSAVAAAPAAALGPLAERAGAGLLVIDLKDSTKLYQEIGNRRAHAVAGAVMDFAAAVAAELGGRVARRLGDGLLIAFLTREDAAQTAARVQERLPSARALLGRPDLGLHVAASGGRVIEDRSGGGFDVYGQAVERALALAAAPDQPAAPAPPGGPAWIQGELSVARLEDRATLFAGLKDWPDRYEAEGRRRAFATVKVFHAYAAAVVARHGGTLVKTSGEAVMASFGSPAGAVRAAAELQNRAGELRRAAPSGDGLDLRVGVSYGRAVRQDTLEHTDYFGNTVNAAARLMRRAGPGGILLSARLLGDPEAKAIVDAGRAEKSRMELKGFAAPIEVYSLDAASVKTGRARSLAAGLRALGRAVLRLLPASQ